MSIRWKYTLMTAALMASLVAACAAFVARAQREVLEAESLERLEALMDGAARVAEESVVNRDRFMLLSYLSFLQRQAPELRLAEVTRRGHTARIGDSAEELLFLDRTVAGAPAKYTITALPRPDGRPAGEVTAGPGGVEVRVPGDARVEVEQPVEEESLRLRLGFSRRMLETETDRAVRALLERTLGIAAGFLGLGVLVSGFVGHRIAEPLTALAQAADEVGRGRLDAAVPDLRRKDEIGVVARRFNAMTLSLRSAVQFREDLLHTLTHELNTPLAGLRGTLELWQDRRPPESPAEYREALGMMVGAVGRMEESLGNALALFRGESRAAAEPRVVWLNELAREAAALFKPVAEAKRVELAVADSVASVLSDPELLRTVVTNLVSNAVKYTGEGGKVRIDLEDLDDRALLSVSDDGPGIRPEDLPHLFTKFFRAGDSGERRRIPGTGLGLTIVKRAVEQLGGRIAVESRRGRGTRFVVVVPKSPSMPLRDVPQEGV